VAQKIGNSPFIWLVAKPDIQYQDSTWTVGALITHRRSISAQYIPGGSESTD
jgi:hypothetical protein